MMSYGVKAKSITGMPIKATLTLNIIRKTLVKVS